MTSKNTKHIILDDNLRKKIIEVLEIGQGGKIKNQFLKLHIADQVSFINSVNSEQRFQLFEVIKNNFDPEILTHFDEQVKNEITHHFGIEKITRAVNKLKIDDAVEFIENLEEGLIDEITSNLPQKKQDTLEMSLSYPENSVGRLMHHDFFALNYNLTVGQATAIMQNKKDLPDQLNFIILIDDDQKPIGEISLAKLLKNTKNTSLSELTSDIDEIRILETNIDQEEGARLFSKYSFNYALVVDDDKKLVGLIYISDVVEILEEEHQEDMLLLGGLNNIDMSLSSFATAVNRFPWLFASLLTSALASLVISFFSSSIEKMVALAILLPITAAIAGNAGTQAMTVLVRIIATNEINESNIVKIIFREVLAALTNGIFLALFGGLIIYFWFGNIALSLVLAASLCATVIIAGFFGAIIPLLLRKMKFDPAISSGVFLITITDIASISIFLGLASLFIL